MALFFFQSDILSFRDSARSWVLIRSKKVYIVGGGNSAGQAAMYLSKFAKQVNILIRKDNLSYTMSSYLIDQINGVDNITVCVCREVVEVKGGDRLELLNV